MRRILVFCLIVGGLLTACTAPRPATPTAPPPADRDALRRDAEFYAAHEGVSLDEALRRLAQQDGIGSLGADLEQHEAATFAGLWIEHQPEYRVVVRFTRGGQATLRRYLRDPQWAELASLIEVRDAQFTLTELHGIQARLMGLLGDGGFRSHSSIDLMANRVTVAVSAPAAVRAYLEAADPTLAAQVEVTYAPASDFDGIP